MLLLRKQDFGDIKEIFRCVKRASSAAKSLVVARVRGVWEPLFFCVEPGSDSVGEADRECVGRSEDAADDSGSGRFGIESKIM